MEHRPQVSFAWWAQSHRAWGLSVALDIWSRTQKDDGPCGKNSELKLLFCEVRPTIRLLWLLNALSIIYRLPPTRLGS
jgi:hypothetical protein